MQQSHYLRFTSFYSLILRDLGVVTDDTSYVILKAYLSILRNEGLVNIGIPAQRAHLR